MEHLRERVRYRLLTGVDDPDFDLKVSAALDEGYELYGSPTIARDGDHMVLAQAVILPAYAAGRYRRPEE